MKNHKQLLMDFYLELLKSGRGTSYLHSAVVSDLSELLNETEETIRRIFERMAAEDGR